jgi:RNA polymerase sigma factor for flagellar operon FliA
MAKARASGYIENVKYAQDDLAVKYLPAVKSMAFKLKERLPASVDTSELISIGTEELVKLARRYDETQNDSFWGYARKRVYGSMLDFLRSLDVVSRGDRKLIKDVDSIIGKYFGEMNEEPSDEYIAHELGIEIDKVREARNSIGVYSILPMNEQLQLYANEDTEEVVEEEELLSHIKNVLDKLSKREQLIVQLYYFEELKLEEISEVLDITTSRISQIHKQVIGKIRNSLMRA